MTTDPIFGDIDAVPTPEGEGDYGPDFKPMPGQYVVTLGDSKFDRSKKGELYLAVEFVLDSGDKWSDVRVLTKNGTPQEGRIKAAKILLRTLGLDGNQPASTWQGQLDMLRERRAYVEVVQNGEYLNTKVSGMDPSTPARQLPEATDEASVPFQNQAAPSPTPAAVFGDPPAANQPAPAGQPF